MVCNAGINWDGVIWKMSEQQWDQVINVNLKGYFNYNKAAAMVFKDRKGGKIVNISSINGMRGKFAQANYAASKGGEIAMSKSLAKELGKFNVNVNVVAPGLVMTDMARNMPPEALNKSMSETVVGRIATPEECADLVVFLASPAAGYVTGETVYVDGGARLWGAPWPIPDPPPEEGDGSRGCGGAGSPSAAPRSGATTGSSVPSATTWMGRLKRLA